MISEPIKLKKGYPILFGLLAVILGAAAGIYAGRTPGVLEATAIMTGILMVAAILVNLDVGLFVLVLLNYLRVSQLLIEYHNAPPIAFAFTALILVAVGIRWILTREAPRGWALSSIIIGLYGIAIFTSTFVAEEFSLAISATLGYLLDAGVAVTVMLIMQTERSFRSAIWALLTCGAILCTVNIFQYFTGTFENSYLGLAQALNDAQIVGEYSGSRLGGPIGDPNYFAEALIVLVPIAFNQIWAERSLILKAISVYVLLACIITIMLTYSRGGFLSLAIVAVALLFYRSPRLGELLLIASIGIIVLSYLPSKYTERLKTIIDVVSGQIDPREEASFRGRESAMLSAWNMFKDYPFFGVGANNYPIRYPAYASQLGIITTSTDVSSPHNLYLEIAAETGLFGLGTFFLVVGVMFNQIRKAMKTFENLKRPDLRDSTIGIALGLFGYFCAAMFIHGSYPRYLWLMIGIGLSVQIVANNMKQQAEEINPETSI
jgi:O-antigen ligase